MKMEGTIYNFTTDYGLIDTRSILNIHCYLTRKYNMILKSALAVTLSF